MSQAADADEAAEKRLCAACIGDSYLRGEVKRQNEVSECSYCGKQRPTSSIGDLAEKCHQVFKTYFKCTPSEPEGVEAIAHNDPEGGYSWGRQGDPAQNLISEFAGIGDDPAHDIRLVLEEQYNSFDDGGEEQEYGEEACYADKAIFGEQFRVQWLEFEKSLRTEARLFNKGARAVRGHLRRDSGTSYTRRNAHHCRCRSWHQIDRTLSGARVRTGPSCRGSAHTTRP
jgi:hypothetical protein